MLVSAWHAIRRNAETSQQITTKHKARAFGEDLPANLRKLQDRLRKGYQFANPYGATPPKGVGKIGKRPIVVAPLEDRIVQRAILDVLQDAKEIAGVQRVLHTPTSIGGIRGKGVSHAIALFDERAKAGDAFVAGSDISGFFTKIPRAKVLNFLLTEGVETAFVKLVEDALTVELSNAATLSDEDRKLFPTGEDGVAQGCPLSALAGNIVLEGFDREMNVRGITCIRYIDDFVVMGRTSDAVQKAMSAGKAILAALNMDIYDPLLAPTKAFCGKADAGYTFLGYKLLPGTYPPSAAACGKMERQLRQMIAKGQQAISKAVTDRPLTSQDRCYAQTLVDIDNMLRGWRRSFQSSNCPAEFERLDSAIDRRLNDFRAFFFAKMSNRTAGQQRRALRVRPLTD